MSIERSVVPGIHDYSQLCSSWQDFNWHSNWRGHSAIAELFICFVGLCARNAFDGRLFHENFSWVGEAIWNVRRKVLLLLILQVNASLTFFLHDAVYLYLRVVNQTLDEGYTDFRDGRLIRSKAVGQQFEGDWLISLRFDDCCSAVRPVA